MSALKDIRRRLHSTENIKKITDAMERVAAVHLRRAQAKAEQSRPYLLKLKKILENFGSCGIHHPLYEQRKAKKIALVVISADRGLCGAYNANIMLAADNFLKEHAPETVELILVGRKAIEYYKKKKWRIRFQFPSFDAKTSFHNIHLFSKRLVDWFLAKELDQIWLVYTQYISIAERKIAVEKFLNIEKEVSSQKPVKLSYIFEPDPQKVLAAIIPRYCDMRIQMALQEAYAAELSSRIMAMRSASKNSEDLIYQLTLTRNKIRQTEITKETIEISSGSESLFAN